jgi:Uma2 family endonuclease
MPRNATAAAKKVAPCLPEHPHGGEPAWEVALLFPPQGRWTEADYWDLLADKDGYPRLELSGGRLDTLPMPTETHQLILVFLLHALEAFASSKAPGIVLLSGLKVRLRKGQVREPDVVYLKAENAFRRGDKYWDGADLVMEVVSDDPKDHERDWKTKAREYARAGIPEYWIIDPQQKVIRVLALRGTAYKVHGDFKPGEEATSVLLPGFRVAVAAALAPPVPGRRG